MKKFISTLILAALILSMTACGQTDTEGTDGNLSSNTGTASGASENQNAPDNVNALVVYFSWSRNTEEMTQYIQRQTGADMIELEPAVPYPEDYSQCGEVALAERDNNERSGIANLPESIEEYNTIFVGYPIWYYTAPMVVGTFLESYDLSGKTVVPFCTSAGSSVDVSLDFIRAASENATVLDGFTANGSNSEIDDAVDGMISQLNEKRIYRQIGQTL